MADETPSPPPRNWGDWRQCKSCLVVQPPKALDPDGLCIDKNWCQRIRHSKPSTNGNGAAAGRLWAGETPVSPEVVPVEPAKAPKPRASRKKKR